jgi:hypothetical protein
MNNRIGRKIYYDKATGNVILDTGEKMGAVVETTVDQDFETYQALKERVRDTVDVIQLEYGQYAEDFAQCNGYRVKQVNQSYADEIAITTDGIVYKIENSYLQYGLDDIVVKVEGNIVNDGFKFEINKIIFDEPQIKERGINQETGKETILYKQVTIDCVKVAELEFSYPDPNATEPQEPVYQKPLTEQTKELKQQLAQINADFVAFMDFYFSNTTA